MEGDGTSGLGGGHVGSAGGLSRNGFSGWHNGEPVAGQDLLYVAPLDAHYAYGMDLDSGDIRFRVQRGDGRFLLGGPDWMAIAGEGGLRFYDPQGGKLLHEEIFPAGSSWGGIPLAVGDLVLCPFVGRVGGYSVSQRQWLSQKEIGEGDKRKEKGPLGNLLFVGERMVSVVGGEAACWEFVSSSELETRKSELGVGKE
jgi:hypothetical protein